MASLTPRMSGVWASNLFQDPMGEADIEQQEQDGRTALDKTIDRIGMGNYQWALLALCGFGWMADNMWIQTIAIILPRVQQHFTVPDSYIGYLSSSMFAGMMIGAVGWGSCSDLLGRSKAFNLTLFFTAVFGLLASSATSFLWLCISLFFLGTSVGGSMPTDGTLLLEHMPQDKLYLVTALSVFFSFGAVLSAVVGIIVIPGHSCPRPSVLTAPCDVLTSNMGWKYLLMTVGLITLGMFLGRIVFFRLYESPRYLVHAGRPEEALLSLQKISRFNGSELSLGLHDVDDRPPLLVPTGEDADARTPFLLSSPPRGDVRTIFDADADGTERFASESPERRGSPERLHYDSTGSSNTPLDAHTFATPTDETPRARPYTLPRAHAHASAVHLRSPTEPPAGFRALSPEPKTAALAKPPARPRTPGSAVPSSRRSSFHEAKARVCWALPRWMRKPLWAWLDRLALVFGPEWIRTTLLVWAMWGFMSLAYTMFNVYLPKLLEMRAGRASLEEAEQKTLEDTMWDIVIFTVGGCPGAILGAYLVETSLGRRLSLAISTFVTAVFCIIFTFAESSLAVRISTIGMNMCATIMWAILYGWTPEIFGTEVRGTACGTASALSRIGGMIAPLLGGALLVFDRSLPVYTSAVIFALAGVCTLLLHGAEGTKSVERVLVH